MKKSMWYMKTLSLFEYNSENLNISDYGAHNQRSRITACVEMNDFIWIEELLEVILSCNREWLANISLSVRLFANMLDGHTMITSDIW